MGSNQLPLRHCFSPCRGNTAESGEGERCNTPSGEKRSHIIRPVDHYGAPVLRALRSIAPPTVSDPTVVVLTPEFADARLARGVRPGLRLLGPGPDQRPPTGELHVKIGHGRDYQDVMPLRGVYHGGADDELGVQVRIRWERLSQMAEQWPAHRFLNGFIIVLGSLRSRSVFLPVMKKEL